MLKTVGNLSSRTGDQTITSGNVVIATDGNGINFTGTPSAPGVTSTVLNDYEEGTWQAVLSDGVNNATMGNATCNYTKIGRAVFVQGYIYTTSLGSVSGNLILRTLPFLTRAGSQNFTATTAGYGDLLNLTAGQSVGLRFAPSSNVIGLYLWSAATGSTPMTHTQWSADGELMFSAAYNI
jgi:hypothetical protein